MASSGSFGSHSWENPPHTREVDDELEGYDDSNPCPCPDHAGVELAELLARAYMRGTISAKQLRLLCFWA